MIVEERIYTVKVGKAGEFAKNYWELGYKSQTRILGRLVGWYVAEVGALNQIVHMWAYKDMNERAERRAKLMQDAEFAKYLAVNVPLIEKQENRILVPAGFFLEQLRKMIAAGGGDP